MIKRWVDIGPITFDSAFYFEIMVLYLGLIAPFNASDVTVKDQQRVIVLSFDAFRWDYLYRLKTLKNGSMFWRLIEEFDGIYAQDGLQSTFATSTFPNHYTMATGLFQESHGVIANAIFDQKLNKTYDIARDASSEFGFLFGGQPIWRTVKDQLGIDKVACYMWIGCSYAKLKYYVPFAAKSEWKNVVNNITTWLNNDVRLIMVYHNEPDSTGHRKGTKSKEINQVLVELDDQLEYLLNTLMEAKFVNHNMAKDVHLIIVSDHGMLDITQNVFIPAKADLFQITTRSYAFFHAEPRPGKEKESMEYLTKFANIVVYNRSSIPAKWGYRNNKRIGQILAVAKPNFAITFSEPQGGTPVLYGGHGYEPELRDMHGIFVARGPLFKSLKTHISISTTDIYLLLCSILNLKPAPNNGSQELVHIILKNNRDYYSFVIWVSAIAVAIFVLIFFLLYLWRQHKSRERFIQSPGDINVIAFSHRTKDRLRLPLLASGERHRSSSSESLESV